MRSNDGGLRGFECEKNARTPENTEIFPIFSGKNIKTLIFGHGSRHNLDMAKKTVWREKPGLSDAFFSFFSEVSVASSGQQPVVIESTGQPVSIHEATVPREVFFAMKPVEQKTKNSPSKVAAEKQRERRKAKSAIGLIRVESYVAKETGQRLGERAKCAGVTQSEVISAAIEKYLAEK